MSGRVARRRAQTRERIFTEAMRLFAERGFDHVTVADITEAADIGKGTFFTHFPSKREIFGYLGEQITEAMASALTDCPASTARERLERLLGAAASWLETHPEPARQMVLARYVNLSLDLDSANQQRLRELLAAILAEAQQAGELRDDVLLEDAVDVLFSSYLACTITWARSSQSRSLRERLNAALDIAFQGLET